MTPEQRKELADNLKSGDFKQGAGKLARRCFLNPENPDDITICYCCLGVATKIKRPDFPMEALLVNGYLPYDLAQEYDITIRAYLIDGPWVEQLSEPVKKKVRLCFNEKGRTANLTWLNDGDYFPKGSDRDFKCNFDEIAEIILVCDFAPYAMEGQY